MVRRRAQTLIEYALLIILIGAFSFTLLWSLGGNVAAGFSTVTSAVGADSPGGAGGPSGPGGSGPIFTYFPEEPTAFEDVSFDGPADATFWQWDFNGDGITDSTVENPVTSFGASGTYAVALTTNAGTSSIGVPVAPFTGRLYPSTHETGDNNTPQSAAAPSLGSNVVNGVWDSWGGNFNVHMMYTSPAGSSAQNTNAGSANWTVVNAGEQDAAIVSFIIRLDDPALLRLVHTGGTITAQMAGNSRHGVGVSEASQDNRPAMEVRVWRPSLGASIGTALPITTVNDLTFPAQSTKVNRTFETQDLVAVPGAESTDYLMVTLGVHHVTPTGGGTGAGIAVHDTSAFDMPIDNTTTGNYNNWIQLGSH